MHEFPDARVRLCGGAADGQELVVPTHCLRSWIAVPEQLDHTLMAMDLIDRCAPVKVFYYYPTGHVDDEGFHLFALPSKGVK